VVEDRLFAIKSREIYETPGPTLLRAAHRDLESLVHSRELLQMKEGLSRRYAELVYNGQWFHDLRRALQSFFDATRRYVTGEVRLRLFKGACHVVGRRSSQSLYDGQLVSQANRETFDDHWAQAFAALWSLPLRVAARRQTPAPPAGGWDTP
jgi:argininosuccinate synthase